MTELTTSAQNIREHSERMFKQFRDAEPGASTYGVHVQLLSAVFEIAAQLAEQNEQIREDRKLRQVILEEQRAETKKRDELLATSAAGIDVFRRSVEASSEPPRRVVSPGEIVHLGCVVREPDGTIAFADALTNSITPIEPSVAQHLLSLSQPAPDEERQKPQ